MVLLPLTTVRSLQNEIAELEDTFLAFKEDPQTSYSRWMMPSVVRLPSLKQSQVHRMMKVSAWTGWLGMSR